MTPTSRPLPLDLEAVLAAVDAQVQQVSTTDPQAHPLAPVIAYYLQAGGPDTGRMPWCLEAMAAAYDRLVRQALTRLLAARRPGEGAP